MDELNRGEISKLFAISISQFRHYEKIGLIKPAYIAENNYRKYGKNEIYRLAYILYLREFNLSLEEIRTCIFDYKQEEVLALLETKKIELLKEIKKMTYLAEHLEASVKSIEKDQIDRFQVKRYPARSYEVFLISESPYMSIKETYQLFSKIHDLYKVDFSLIYKDDKYYHCAISRAAIKEQETLELVSGSYLSYLFGVENEEDVDVAYAQLTAYAMENNITLSDIVLMTENSLLSITSSTKMFYRIEARIIE